MKFSQFTLKNCMAGFLLVGILSMYISLQRQVNEQQEQLTRQEDANRRHFLINEMIIAEQAQRLDEIQGRRFKSSVNGGSDRQIDVFGAREHIVLPPYAWRTRDVK